MRRKQVEAGRRGLPVWFTSLRNGLKAKSKVNYTVLYLLKCLFPKL